MADDHALDVLKQAILLERRGMAFYRQAAEAAENEDVRRFFEMMAAEEEGHIRYLSDQYKHYTNRKTFYADDQLPSSHSDVSSAILIRDLKEKISAAGFEAAAISAAIDMEERAVRLYSKRAAESDIPDEKTLYAWLADWEKTHLQLLNDLDRELTEKIWHDNQFWPF